MSAHRGARGRKRSWGRGWLWLAGLVVVAGLGCRDEQTAPGGKAAAPHAAPAEIAPSRPSTGKHQGAPEGTGGETTVDFILPEADAPTCADCGSMMVRNGACYKCLNCGATSGCS